MGITALIVRLLIAVIFSVAGVSKLTNIKRTRNGIRGFGVPEWAAGPLGILLPLAELCVAALLIPTFTVLWGSLGGIVLLVVFIAGISVNLAKGRRPECNCFGQLHSKPIGWPTLVRNCILTCGAAFVLWEARNGGSMGVIGWTSGMSNAETAGSLLGVTAFLTIVAEGWLAMHLLRQNGRLMLRMDALETQLSNGIAPLSANATAPSGLPIGTLAPAFELPLLSSGSLISLDTLRAEGSPVVLIFSDPDCGPCSDLLPQIARWEREYAGSLTIAVVSRGTREANRLKIGSHRLKYVILQKDREVGVAYEVKGTPGAVLIGRDGMVASSAAMGSQSIAGLVTTGKVPVAAALATNGKYNGTAAPPAGSIELNIGDMAPALRLPDLNGKILDLAALRKQDTLVLFWNPTCGFCSKMLADLKTWEENRPAKAPQLLVVSAGSIEANRAMGLRSPVVLDPTFATGTAFHVRGTPAAVLVDNKGKIASGIANGAPAVLSLANGHRPEIVQFATDPILERHFLKN